MPSVSSSVSVGSPIRKYSLTRDQPRRERGVDGAVEVVLGDQLVDHLAQPPRAGLGGEREPAAPPCGDLPGEADGERVDAQRRQVDRRRAARCRGVTIGEDAADDVARRR